MQSELITMKDMMRSEDTGVVVSWEENRKLKLPRLKRQKPRNSVFEKINGILNWLFVILSDSVENWPLIL